MAAQAGKDMLVEVNTTDTTYVVIGGVRQIRKRGGRNTIDVTTASSTNLDRVLMDGGGVYAETISVSGVFEDDAAVALVESLSRTGALKSYKMTVPDYGVYEADYQVADFEHSSQYDGTVEFSLTLESSGAITFTAA